MRASLNFATWSRASVVTGSAADFRRLLQKIIILIENATQNGIMLAETGRFAAVSKGVKV